MAKLFRLPSLFSSTIRLLALLLWRDPAVDKTQSQPKQPRRPIFYYSECPMPEGVAAIVRYSWFKQGRAKEVEEFRVESHRDWPDTLHYIVLGALQNGADVYLLSSYQYEELELDEMFA